MDWRDEITIVEGIANHKSLLLSSNKSRKLRQFHIIPISAHSLYRIASDKIGHNRDSIRVTQTLLKLVSKAPAIYYA